MQPMKKKNRRHRQQRPLNDGPSTKRENLSPWVRAWLYGCTAKEIRQAKRTTGGRRSPTHDDPGYRWLLHRLRELRRGNSTVKRHIEAAARAQADAFLPPLQWPEPALPRMQWPVAGRHVPAATISAMLEPWVTRSLRRLDAVVGCQLSDWEVVPAHLTALVEAHFLTQLRESKAVKDVVRELGPVAHQIFAACWWVLNETTRWRVVLHGERVLSKRRAARRRRASAAARASQERQIAAARALVTAMVRAMGLDDEALAAILPSDSTSRHGRKPAYSDRRLWCHRIFQIIATDTAAAATQSSSHPKGRPHRLLIAKLTAEFSAFGDFPEPETTIKREIAKHRATLASGAEAVQRGLGVVLAEAAAVEPARDGLLESLPVMELEQKWQLLPKGVWMGPKKGRPGRAIRPA